MQQRWTNRHETRRTRLEPYPTPSVEAPAAWPEGMSPAATRGPETPEAAGSAANAAGPNMELEGVYIISVAARLLEMHPQTLRKYERLGLIQPVRTVGMLRLYSQDDLRKVMLIRHLMDNLGLNLAGVEFALKLVNNLSVFSRRLARATDDAEVVENIRQEVAMLCNSLSLPAPE
ncbi:MAG: MerR family transcriptional regulator [Chloroflexota bacterium]|nr:MerR family transcriptional regulator [Chloroflexota bacterium]MDE2959861.1 MerR family transcriptional regulator [Chloroflexota bacterium]